MTTHGIRIDYGKHKGELFTRIPVSYLRWMINEKAKDHEIARAEFERRGDTMPKVELSGHAIDNASLRVRKIWHETSEDGEGLYSWLQRMTLEAIDHRKKIEREQCGLADITKAELPEGVTVYNGMKLVISDGEEFPTLKTVMRA